MKKYLGLLMLGLIAVTTVSCKDDDNDTYAVVYDITDSFIYDSKSDSYVIPSQFNREIPLQDYVLIYRKTPDRDSKIPVWEPLPLEKYLEQGNLKYRYDYTKRDANIYLSGTMDINAQNDDFKNSYLYSQTFRIVVAPGSNGNIQERMSLRTQSSTKEGQKYMDYLQAAKKFHIDESKVIRIK